MRDDPKTTGCPDRDGDGILDKDDACPDEKGVKSKDPKKHGCPLPDRDKDGILDKDDACPDDPGPKRDDPKTNGCPDRDKDGIVDIMDACPDVPGVRSDDPKKHGCPETGQKVVLTAKKIEILEKVYFDFAKATLQERSFDLLNQVADVLKGHPEIKRVRVEGHTDSKGKPDYNKRLSQARADSVVKYLTGKGVEPGRLEGVGYGMDRPIAENKTDAGREKNRRVEFIIVEQEGVEGGVKDHKADTPPTPALEPINKDSTPGAPPLEPIAPKKQKKAGKKK